MPSLIRNCMAPRNVWSSINPSAHHPALLRTQSGTDPDPSPVEAVSGTDITPSLIRNCSAPRNVWSSINPSAHHPALLRTQSGMSGSAGAAGSSWTAVGAAALGPISRMAVPMPACIWS